MFAPINLAFTDIICFFITTISFSILFTITIFDLIIALSAINSLSTRLILIENPTSFCSIALTITIFLIITYFSNQLSLPSLVFPIIAPGQNVYTFSSILEKLY